jgi:hypothetical protein
MSRPRWITYLGRQWRLSELADVAGLRPQTLASRLNRGYTTSRALTTGLCSREEAGRRGAHLWRDA